MPSFLPSLLGVLLLALVGTWLLFVGFARLGGYNVLPWAPRFDTIPDDRLFDLTRSTATAAALFGGVFAIVYSYRKQKVEEAESQRADEEGLSVRYQDAAQQLGHDKAAVRLAGVYAIARLADDWPESRQTIVDVLCAYLRMPIPEKDTEARLSEIEVRSSILAAMNERLYLNTSEECHWADLRFNFRGAELYDADFQNCVFRTTPDFTGATFRGFTNFIGTHFGDSAYFTSAMIEDEFATRCFVRQRLYFEHAQVLPAATLRVIPHLTISDSRVLFGGLVLQDAARLRLRLGPRKHGDAGSVLLTGLELHECASVAIDLDGPPTDADVIDNLPRISASGWSMHPDAWFNVEERALPALRWEPPEDMNSNQFRTHNAREEHAMRLEEAWRQER